MENGQILKIEVNGKPIGTSDMLKTTIVLNSDSNNDSWKKHIKKSRSYKMYF